MGYNHGLEKKKFDIEWQKNEKLYRELGSYDYPFVMISIHSLREEGDSKTVQ